MTLTNNLHLGKNQLRHKRSAANIGKKQVGAADCDAEQAVCYVTVKTRRTSRRKNGEMSFEMEVWMNENVVNALTSTLRNAHVAKFNGRERLSRVSKLWKLLFILFITCLLSHALSIWWVIPASGPKNFTKLRTCFITSRVCIPLQVNEPQWTANSARGGQTR